MRCRCLPRFFRRPTVDTCPLLTADGCSPTEAKSHVQHFEENATKHGYPLSEENGSGEEAPEDAEKPEDLSSPCKSEKSCDVKSVSNLGDMKKVNSLDRQRKTGPLLKYLFKPTPEITSWENDLDTKDVVCDFHVDEETQKVIVHFTIRMITDLSESKCSNGGGTGVKLSPSIPSFFRLLGKKNKSDEVDFATSDLIPARRESPISSKSVQSEAEQPDTIELQEAEEGNEEIAEQSRPRERSGFICFGWGVPGTLNDDDEEAIAKNGDSSTSDVLPEAPPGLVGLVNLGNTCFLNAALQCLRCTPGFARLIVPEFLNGFDHRLLEDPLLSPPFLASSKSENLSLKNPNFNTPPLLRRSLSSSSLEDPKRVGHEWDLTPMTRSQSLPARLPLEIGGLLKGESGLAGGAGIRLPSLHTFVANNAKMTSTLTTETGSVHKETKGEIQEDNSEDSAKDNDSSRSNNNNNNKNNNENEKIADQDSERKEKTEDQELIEDPQDIEFSEDFISAFRKLMLTLCCGESNSFGSTQDLYQQMKKLPQGEWLCDGGQHDCQEILKVLLDTIHDEYNNKPTTEDNNSTCPPQQDFSQSTQQEEEKMEDSAEEEILKADNMWNCYLSKDSSPITDVFAGQLQIIRTCQKCHALSTTYEPFWDLSLSLSREKSGWFNAGRMPSCLDDLLRAFTTAELLQGADAPFCEKCGQKSPATRRILIHRFPSVLVLNIKRFKYTKEGREKLTSSISFPVKSLRLQNFASNEHRQTGETAVYDLYAVSNHYGTLGGGHYTACCKVTDNNNKEGWFCFNDKTVVKVSEDAVATPNAYILFYAKHGASKTKNVIV